MAGVEPGPKPKDLVTSASAPVIREPPPSNEEYTLPVTTLPPKVPLGKFPKDTGETTSRLADIQKQAKKTPAPGKYDKVYAWADASKKTGTRQRGEAPLGFGFKFENASRWKGDAQDMVRKRGPMPGPGHYESKEVNVKNVNSCKANLSDMKRAPLGFIAKGKKETFLDKIGKGGPPGPNASKYAAIKPGVVARNMLEPHIPALAWTKAATVSRKEKAKPTLAPNHYSINYKSQDFRVKDSSFPREKAANFIDQTVRNKNWTPPPGKYTLIPLGKYSRGTKYCQVNNIGRSAVNNMF
ncbi:unnamed protein product [Amoebophrya sp. A25]|nr:unnamed protein product [Amoebophrya sp. A25]|eukprot:GSA25T00026483001.1